MKLLLGIVLILAAILTSSPAFAANEIVEKTICKLAVGYQDVDEIKADLLVAAKREVINELFGEMIVASTAVENFVVTSDQIRTSSIGFVRVDGNANFFNGRGFAEVCVTIQAFITDEDRDKFNPERLKKKYCDADDNLTTAQLIVYVKDEAVIQALIEYNPKLKGADKDSLLQLVQKVTYLESGFISDTQTYCAEFEGFVVPVEITAFLEVKQDTIREDSQRKITFGSFDQTRVGGFSFESGQTLEQARESLIREFPEIAITFFPELGSETLNDIDIVYLLTATGNASSAKPLSKTEQANLLDFVQRGGCAILLPDNDSYSANADVANESLIDAFGMDASGTLTGKVVASVSDIDHNQISNGAYGTISSFAQFYPGAITNTGKYGVSIATNNLGSAVTVVPKDAIQSGSGAVIIFSDVASFMNDTAGGYFSENEVLFLNTVDYCLAPKGGTGK